jgi:hypothetical protein
MRVGSHALLWGRFEALDNLISIPVLRNHRDGFSYFRSGGGGGGGCCCLLWPGPGGNVQKGQGNV